MKPLIADFRPQAWINDYTIDIDEKTTFDATTKLLELPLEKIQSFQEHSYDSDDLARDVPGRLAHRGPFEVDIDVDGWLDSIGYPPRNELTEDLLTKLRVTFGIS